MQAKGLGNRLYLTNQRARSISQFMEFQNSKMADQWVRQCYSWVLLSTFVKVANSYKECSGLFMIRNYLSGRPDVLLQNYVVEFDLQVCELARQTNSQTAKVS